MANLLLYYKELILIPLISRDFEPNPNNPSFCEYFFITRPVGIFTQKS